jgi:hypothetical protein
MFFFTPYGWIAAQNLYKNRKKLHQRYQSLIDRKFGDTKDLKDEIFNNFVGHCRDSLLRLISSKQ